MPDFETIEPVYLPGAFDLHGRVALVPGASGGRGATLPMRSPRAAPTLP